ncbi:hypothetical protein HBN50_12445 [Halobacteriovorax sp. GB3]|uniref:hypothetical protein n=1 Tax=Halobacteriovorax sp. GB3 TaxID=2719615 RepID=UPI002362CB35|nr:hypothetical protein [Halobacteriovorax sp. GB3]MDD0853913.1 hypothetical protein [Halobacteriovorax sp. GB3]
MKKMILIGLTLVATSAAARTKTVVPQMLLENGFEFQSTKVTDICQNADGTFQALAKNKCVQYSRKFNSRNEYLDAENGCLKYGSLMLFGAATKTTGKCVQWGRDGSGEEGCLDVEYTTTDKPLTYTIKKYKVEREDGDDVLGKVVSSWNYTIPACL